MIAAIEVRQSELGIPEEADGETSPRRVVGEALTYLRNNNDRMRYDEYRKAGLPMTSSHMESTVKMFNRRVKGTEKFWSEEGAEAILQLRADHLSETEPLKTFWENRQATAPGRRRTDNRDKRGLMQSQSSTQAPAAMRVRRKTIKSPVPTARPSLELHQQLLESVAKSSDWAHRQGFIGIGMNLDHSPSAPAASAARAMGGT